MAAKTSPWLWAGVALLIGGVALSRRKSSQKASQEPSEPDSSQRGESSQGSGETSPPDPRTPSEEGPSPENEMPEQGADIADAVTACNAIADSLWEPSFWAMGPSAMEKAFTAMAESDGADIVEVAMDGMDALGFGQDLCWERILERYEGDGGELVEEADSHIGEKAQDIWDSLLHQASKVPHGVSLYVEQPDEEGNCLEGYVKREDGLCHLERQGGTAPLEPPPPEMPEVIPMVTSMAEEPEQPEAGTSGPSPRGFS